MGIKYVYVTKTKSTYQTVKWKKTNNDNYIRWKKKMTQSFILFYFVAVLLARLDSHFLVDWFWLFSANFVCAAWLLKSES